MTALWLIATLPTLAVLGALVVPAGRGPRVVRAAALAPLAAIPLVLAGPRAGAVDLPWLLLGVRLEIDAVGRPLLLVAALLYAAALAATPQAVPERRPAFAAFLLACWLGNAGVLVAADAATFYGSFAVMSFCAFGLVVHDRTASAFRAGRVYLVLTVFGELALISGLFLVVAAGGRLIADAPAAVAGSPLRDLAVALLMVGFGVKAGLVPFHGWLPLAHPAAPAPASAVLSGCMVKAGLVGMVRFFPLGEVAMPRAGAVLGALALAGAFLAVVVGLTQRDPKANLAYSTISQMGFHLVLVGVALTSPDLAPAAVAATVLYAVHHGMAKGALFLGVAVHKAYGASAARYLVRGGLVLSALAVSGAPFTGGAAAKYSAKEAVHGAGVAGVELVTVLPFVAVGSTLLLFRFLRLLPEPKPARVAAGVPGLLASWIAVMLLGTPLTWVLAAHWAPDAPSPSATLSASLTAAWPVLLALALIGVAAWLVRPRNLPQMPPGDLVVLGEAGIRWLRGRVGAWIVPRPRWATARGSPVAVVDVLERRLVGRRASGLALLAVLSLLTLAMGAS